MIDKASFSSMLCAAAGLLDQNSDWLSQIDSKYGDGDHGITMRKVARLMVERVEAWGDVPLKEFLDNLGDGIMEVRGGSAGPLYGTLVCGLAEGLEDGENEVSAAGLKRMFASCLAEMQEITTAQVGDKTMMDALIPAVQAAQEAPDNERAVLEAAACAADQGVRASEGFASKFGRARSYGDQTIGTPDAGAASTMLILRGFMEGYQSA